MRHSIDQSWSLDSDSNCYETAEDEIPETSNTSQHRNSAATSSRTTVSIITKEDIDICDILYHRMCEVECEMHELNRCCEAWRRLNYG